MNFGAGAGGDGRWQQAEGGDEGGHEYRAQAGEGAFADGVFEGLAFFAELIDEGN